jgi:hypothetical protein
MAKDIGVEIHSQTAKLNRIDNMVDKTSGKINNQNKTMRHILND